MPLPLALGALLTWGARAAVGVAASYACEKAVENTVGDNPGKYACYLLPFSGVTRATGIIAKGSKLAILAIRKPYKIIPAVKVILGKSIPFLKKITSGGFVGAFKLVGGLTRKVLSNVLVRFGVFAALITATISVTGFVYNFNFNVTDNELNKQIEESIKSFYGLLGGATGAAAGYLMCGALPGTLLFAFNPAVALVAMSQLDEEVRGNLYSQVASISRLTFQTLINAELSRQFMNARRYLKRSPNHPVSKLVKRIMGDKAFKKWGDDNQPSFTIREKVEKKIEALPDGIKQFTENFLENFTESCIESGFVIANNVDSAIAANILAQRNIIGNPVEVSVELNPELPVVRP